MYVYATILAEIHVHYLFLYKTKVVLYVKMASSVDASLIDNPDVTTSFCQTTIDLQNALRSSVENVLNAVTDDLFVELYKECYKGFEKKDEVKKPSLSGSSIEAKKYRKQFNALVTQSVEETVKDTLFTKMDGHLRQIEDLKEEQTDTSFVWRPPGNAMKHMIPFDTVSKMEKKEKIENLIKAEREFIDMTKVRITQRRLKAKELHDALQSSLKSIQDSYADPVPKESCNGNIRTTNQNELLKD